MTKSRWRAERDASMIEFGIEYQKAPDKDSANQNFKLFTEIENWGNTVFEVYCRNDGRQKRPWEEEIVRTASNIASLAHRRQNQKVDEDTWRFTLEQRILRRFEVEVTCPECGDRLWIHETKGEDVNVNGENIGLKKHRGNRKACRCTNRNVESASELFNFHIGTAIFHEDEVKNYIKRMEKPDLIYGLFPTERLTKLIFDADRSKKEITLSDYSPFQDDRKLLFPFLVLEAKSSTGDSDIDALRQSAFIVRRLLRLQHSLKLRAGKRSAWAEGGPFVWYLSNRGSLWIVHGAYTVSEGKYSVEDPGHVSITLIHDGHTDETQKIVEAWRGDISTQNDALRLLLIVDCIVNWARDEYRLNIMNELRVIAGRKPISIIDRCSESDIWSHRQPAEVDSMASMVENLNLNSNDLAEETPQSAGKLPLFEYFDDEGFALRDSTVMHRNVVGVYLTKDNIMDFLGFSRNRSVTRKRARKLLRLLTLPGTWSVSPDTLQGLHECWTPGQTDVLNLWGQEPDESLLVRVFGQSYLSVEASELNYGHLTDWQQTHDLYYVAIQLGAIPQIKTVADYLSRRKDINVKGFPRPKNGILIDLFQQHLQMPVAQALRAAIAGEKWQLYVGEVESVGNDTSFEYIRQAPSHDADSWESDEIIIHDWDEDVLALTILQETYNQLLVGRTEIRTKFLNVSRLYGRRPIPTRTLQHADVLWPEFSTKLSSSSTAVLVSCEKLEKSCIFLLPPFPAIRHAFHTPIDLRDAFTFGSRFKQQRFDVSKAHLMTEYQIKALRAIQGVQVNFASVEQHGVWPYGSSGYMLSNFGSSLEKWEPNFKGVADTLTEREIKKLCITSIEKEFKSIKMEYNLRWMLDQLGMAIKGNCEFYISYSRQW